MGKAISRNSNCKCLVGLQMDGPVQRGGAVAKWLVRWTPDRAVRV